MNQRTTLVSAPAGHGKTTAVNLWLEAIAQPYAWLSLDEHDSNLAVFAAYLVAALRTVYSKAGRSLSAGLAGPHDAQAETLAALFLKDLEALGKPLVLVLHDYHLVRELIPMATLVPCRMLDLLPLWGVFLATWSSRCWPSSWAIAWA